MNVSSEIANYGAEQSTARRKVDASGYLESDYPSQAFRVLAAMRPAYKACVCVCACPTTTNREGILYIDIDVFHLQSATALDPGRYIHSISVRTDRR